MKIIQVIIDNYRSIKHVDFVPTSGINAFIGANSCGKSNIFDAINWILGPSYPSFNSVTKQDHYLGDENNKIKVVLKFSDGHLLELNEHKVVSRYGTEIKSGLFYDSADYNCRGDIREKYCSAYLGVDRKILDYLPSSKWTLIGRILQEINNKFSVETYNYKGEVKAKKEWLKEWLQVIRDRLLFSVKDESGQEVMQRFMSILREESARQLNRPESDFIVDLSLYDPWNFYRTLQLIVKEQDMDLEFQASDLGMGVQASISIAILKAYSELNLSNMSPIFIDEPELYLHPQAQRNFYKILQELSKDKIDVDGTVVREGTQIFYTTHSPNFLSTGNFNEIYLVSKSKEKGTTIRYSTPINFVNDLLVRKGISSTEEHLLLHYRNAYENTGDTQKANEGYFAKKIILVEGQSESLLLPYLFELIGFDYVKECISIVRCGCKNELDRFYRLYSEYGIPCYLLFDGDKQLIGTDQESNNEDINNTLSDLVGEQGIIFPDNEPKEKYFGFEYKLENNLGYATTKKGLDLFIEVKNKINNGEISIPSWVYSLADKIKILPAGEVASVLKKE